MSKRRRNWWNTWQHYKKLAGSGSLWGKWAFNYIKAFMPKDKLEKYSRVG